MSAAEEVWAHVWRNWRTGQEVKLRVGSEPEGSEEDWCVIRDVLQAAIAARQTPQNGHQRAGGV